MTETIKGQSSIKNLLDSFSDSFHEKLEGKGTKVDRLYLPQQCCFHKLANIYSFEEFNKCMPCY